jgi:hypothetical protein
VKSVGSVEAALARSGRGLDMWRKVNAGEPAPTRTGTGRDWSGAPPGSVGDRLAGPGDGPMSPSP